MLRKSLSKPASVVLSFIFTAVTAAHGQTVRQIAMDDLQDKIAGAWIGQIVGNIYGLPFEIKYIDEPGPETWPYGYTTSLKKLIQHDGAFSDDDTDIEYMYLAMMEKYGIEPTYDQLRRTWMHHVHDKVWLANRAALGLMHSGFTPPYTGMASINPHWFQIDPQLINEIWGYTSPGMVRYAAAKSDWGARAMSDGWAVSPTVHYGAMYAAAFFETDIRRLITDALDVLPDGDRYRETVLEMISLYDRYPDDWKRARAAMADKYYHNEPPVTRTIWNANLNGACAILALLYGGSDFQLTMDVGVALGFDCDNQTATLGGLMGVMYGAGAIPRELTHPVEGWTEPFNNKYINVTRYDMPDATIDDLVRRTVQQAVRVVCAHGGSLGGTEGDEVLNINTDAVFLPAPEFCEGPAPRLEIGSPAAHDFRTSANNMYKWSLDGGTLPPGMGFEGGVLSGTPERTGKYTARLAIDNGTDRIARDFELTVRGRNIAPLADTILANVRTLNREVLDSCWYTFSKSMYAPSVDVINDGKLNGEGSVFYTIASKSRIPKIDYVGYGFDAEVTVNMIALHTGCIEEFGGWFRDLSVQYMDGEGRWRNVCAHNCTPALPRTDIVFFQPHFVEYLLEFEPVTTTAVRVLIDTAQQPNHWNKYTREVSSFTSITELSVYLAE